MTNLVSDDVLAEAIVCCDSWEPHARLIGNVGAKELGDLLRELRKRRLAAELGGVIPATFNMKPVPYESGVTYYSCQHYPPDALRRYPCDQGCK